MRAPAHTILLLLALPMLLALECNWNLYEDLRRVLEGHSDTLASAAEVEAEIAAVEAGVRIHWADLDTHTIAERMAIHSVPGVAVAVIDGGRIDWVKGYGEEEAGSGRAVTPGTRFQAASISKPTTAVAALSLVDAGILTLDGDVEEILTSWQIPPNPYTATSPVTVRRMLSHLAGFNVPSFFGYFSPPLPTLVQVLDGRSPSIEPAIAVESSPGLFYRYSGGGFTVLQQVIEDATSQPFEDVLRERVLARAGMHSSDFSQPLPASDCPRASAHLGDQPLPQGAVLYPQLAAAGLWTTPLDLARLVLALEDAGAGRNEYVLSQEMAREMMTTEWLGSGLGVFLEIQASPRYFWHSGQNLGFESLIVGRAEGSVGAVVMTNSGPGGLALAHEIVNGIAQVYQWPEWSGLP